MTHCRIEYASWKTYCAKNQMRKQMLGVWAIFNCSIEMFSGQNKFLCKNCCVFDILKSVLTCFVINKHFMDFFTRT